MSLTIGDLLVKWAHEIMAAQSFGGLDEETVRAVLHNMKDLLSYAQEFTEI